VTTAQLIDRAKDYVRRGAVIEVLMPAGSRLGPRPVESMLLAAPIVKYVLLGEDKTHISELKWLDEGQDDGDVVLVPSSPDGMVITISQALDNRDLDALKEWKARAENGAVGAWMEGGLEDVVSFGG
jgi:hypothetical protein